MGKRIIFTIMMLISQSDDHRPADVGETEAEVAEGKAMMMMMMMVMMLMMMMMI